MVFPSFISRILRRPRAVAILILLPALLASGTVSAQLIDAFEDCDFHSNPSWRGDVDHWIIGSLNGPALQSNGVAAADTIFLAASSTAAYGTWRFTFAHKGVNLSSFNGARIFFIADRADSRKSAVGYYLQLGTNNADAVSLWRADGSLATQRAELGRSAGALVQGDSSRLDIVVERDVFGRFRVLADNELVISATDNLHTTGAFFSMWVKHTAQGAASFLLDDIQVTEEVQEDGPVPRPLELVINEILFDPLPGQSEFIELQNRSETAFDLRMLRFRDERSEPHPLTYSKRMIAPGEFIVLVHDSVSFLSAVQHVPFVAPETWPSLNNGGDVVVLSGPRGVIDSLSYDGGGSDRGISLERIDPEAPPEPYNFTASQDPTGSSPGRVNSVFLIDDAGPRLRFVEETGSGVLELHFDEPIRMEDINSISVQYDNAVVDLLPLSDSSIQLTLEGTLSEPTIEVRNVRDRKGNLSESVEHEVSFYPRPGDLALSEILFEPIADPYDGRADQVEFVELVNTSGRQLSLTSLMRTRAVDELGDADTLRFGREYASAAPGAYLVISDGDSASIRDAFPASGIAASAIFVRAPGLTLQNGGDQIRIHNRLGSAIEDVTYLPEWHHPDLTESRGFSLERIDIAAPANDAASWSSSTAREGATPGALNSLARRQPPATGSAPYGLSIDPSPFSPDGDGHEDAAVISYVLRSSAPNIRVRIYDMDGFEVRDLQPAGLSGPSGRFIWDGRGDAGRMLRVGVYIIVFEAVDAETRAVERFKKPVVLARRFR